jgi:hypothetical protein
MRTRGISPLAKPEMSRFPRKELPHMPGSSTTPGRADTRDTVSVRVAFRDFEHVGTRDYQAYAAQWLALCVLPCRRFADTLADAHARLGADVDRYSFTVVDLHRLLLAGFDRRTKNLTDRAKTPCRNGNEQLSNPLTFTHDICLPRGGRWGIYLARHLRASEFSHGLLNFRNRLLRLQLICQSNQIRSLCNVTLSGDCFESRTMISRPCRYALSAL